PILMNEKVSFDFSFSDWPAPHLGAGLFSSVAPLNLGYGPPIAQQKSPASSRERAQPRQNGSSRAALGIPPHGARDRETRQSHDSGDRATEVSSRAGEGSRQSAGPRRMDR